MKGATICARRVGFGKPVLPPFDFACLKAPQCRTMTKAVIGFNSIPYHFSYLPTLRIIARYPVKSLTGINHESESLAKIAAAPCLMRRVTHIDKDLHARKTH